MPRPAIDLKEAKESFERICEFMGGDLMTVKEALEKSGEEMSYHMFRKLIREKEDFRTLYKIAKEEQAEICIDEMKKALRGIINETLSPKAAASAFAIWKWLSEKYAPREYGDRAAILLEEMKGKLEDMIGKEMNGNLS